VRVFDGRTGAVVQSFFAYEAGFTGGVRVAAGDVNGDGAPLRHQLHRRRLRRDGPCASP
jgi:hypothetical protein